MTGSLFTVADLFVLPTLSESCSMALLEAMSFGLPIITTRVGGNTSLISNEIHGLLVAPGCVEELAAAIRQVALDEPLRQSLGSAAAERVLQRYTWVASTKRYEELYRRAIAKQSMNHESP